jgi:ATP-dependent RNA helicase DeaD
VFEEKKLPTPEEARKVWTDRHVTELKDAMSSSIFEAFIPLAQELRNRNDGDWLVAFALKYFFTHHRIEKMTDVQKAEHKRKEHERKEAVPKELEGRGREGGRRRDGQHGDVRRRGSDEGHGRDPRRERAERAERTDRGERRAGDGEGRHRRNGEAHDVPVTREAGAERGAAEAVEVPATIVPADANAERASAGEGRPPRARIFVSLGELDGADEAKVREAIASLSPGTEVRAVELRRSHSFVEVSPESLDATVQALHGKEWNGKLLTAERARRRRR